ncbi:MAG: hypothetical protein E7142_04160 [Rikenellaceae bacterium]|nr:hypothetical protein [Rikenellaceae bacterium]
MKQTIKTILGLLVAFVVTGCSSFYENHLAICGGEEVRIVDMSKSEGRNLHEVWSWRIDEPTEGLPAEYSKYLMPLDECKFVDGNRKLLLTSSHSAVVLLDIKSRKCDFDARVPMAHSADLLPNNRIAVALSTNKKGNSLEIYDIAQPEKVLFRDSLYSGHGAVWHAERESLYALGYDVLREYKLKDWQTATPSLELVASWPIPIRSGHDLVKVDAQNMLVSGHEGVMWFNVESGEFEPFEPLKNTVNVKSVNYNKNLNRLIYTKGEISWWTHNVYQVNPDKTITIDSMNIYKVRPAW